MKLEDLKIYLIRNSSDQYYRRLGQVGYGSCWTDDAGSASVWTTMPPARSRISWFSNHYPDFPIPDLIEIAAGTVTVLDETERIAKSKARIRKAKEEQDVRSKKHALERAERELDEAKANLAKIMGTN